MGRSRADQHPRGAILSALAGLAALLGVLAVAPPSRALPPPDRPPPPAAVAQPDEPEALAAVRHPDDSASEHWDLTARFTDGHALFVRTMITNAGPGSNTAVVIGHVSFPDGRVYPFDNGRREGRWQVSSDGLSLKVGGSRLEMNGASRGFSKQSKKQRIQLEMRFRARPTVLDADAGPPAVAASTIAPIEGRFQVGDMPAPVSVEGVVFLRHAWGATSEAEHTRRWVDVIAGTVDDGVVLWGLETPRGARRQWLAVVRDGRTRLATSAFRFAAPDRGGREPGYPAPSRIEIEGDEVVGQVTVGRERVRADPMAIIPQPFRWFLSREIAPRRILLDAEVELRTREGELLVDGPALVGVTWTNPLR